MFKCQEHKLRPDHSSCRRCNSKLPIRTLADRPFWLAQGSDDAVGGDELVGHLDVATGLVDEGEIEGGLSPQIHLVIGDTLLVWMEESFFEKHCCIFDF